MEHDVKRFLDFAVGDSDLPPGFVATVVHHGRRRRNGLRIAAVTAAVAASTGIVAVASVVRDRSESPPLGSPSQATALPTSSYPSRDSAAGATALERVVADLKASGRTKTAADVIVSASSGGVRYVMFSRGANGDDEKAFELWKAPERLPFIQLSDYISYEYGCLSADLTCQRLGGVPQGALAAHRLSAGRYIVLVSVPAGWQARVTTQEGARPRLQEGERGYFATVTTSRPWDMLVEVTTADGDAYRLPWHPGAVVE